MITCFFENKHKTSLRHVTVGAIMVKDNKILLVKRAANLINPNKYALPGGFLDRDENSAQGILREVKEETGWQGKIICLFRINDSPKRPQEDRQNVDFIFLVEPIKKVGKPDWEIKETFWFDLDKLPDKKDFAFDHLENIELYKKYLNKKFPLPIF